MLTGAKMPAVLMASENVELFRASLKRCLATPHFLGSFYDSFMASSEEVREKFRDTDFERQTRMLADSLYALAVAAQARREGSPGWADMPRLAARHGHADLDIRPGLYDNWLDCLIETARQHDPEFSPELEAAWRETLGVGIEYMRSRH
jgi:hemoglobin-like flavoprotein